jgi:uncharacterized protein YoxC
MCDHNMQKTCPNSVRNMSETCIKKHMSTHVPTISEKSPESVKHMSKHVPHISEKCQESVRTVSKQCPNNVQQVSKSVRNISNKCQNMSTQCQKHVQEVSNTCHKISKTCPTSVPKVSQTYPTSVQQVSSNVCLQLADAYFWIFLHLIIPELEALSPLFRLSNVITFARVIIQTRTACLQRTHV